MKKTTRKSVARKCCPICMSEDIERLTTEETIKDRSGKEYSLDKYESSICGTCGAHFVTAEQARSNEKQYADARRAEQGLLTTEQVAKIRRKLELRQEDASKYFGGGANAFSKYELGYVTQSVAMDRLLRIAAKHPDLILPLLQELAGDRTTVRRKVIVQRPGRSSADRQVHQNWFVTEDVSLLRAANTAWESEHHTKRRVQQELRTLDKTYSENNPACANG